MNDILNRNSDITIQGNVHMVTVQRRDIDADNEFADIGTVNMDIMPNTRGNNQIDGEGFILSRSTYIVFPFPLTEDDTSITILEGDRLSYTDIRNIETFIFVNKYNRIGGVIWLDCDPERIE